MRQNDAFLTPGWRVCITIAATLMLVSFQLNAQPVTADKQPSVGDAPAIALPLATDLSSKITHRDVRRAIRKVGDWQLNRVEPDFNQDWTFAALYAGFMAVPNAAGGKRYRKAMRHMGENFSWQPGPRLAHALDQAVGQTYLELFERTHNPAMMAPIRARMDAVMQLPDRRARQLWFRRPSIRR